MTRTRKGWAGLVAGALGALLATAQPSAGSAPAVGFTPAVTAIPLPSGPSPRYSSGEPRLLVTPSGRVLIAAHYQPWDCTTGKPLVSSSQSCVWASQDGRHFSVTGGVADRLTVDVDLARLHSGVLLETTLTNPAGLPATSGVPVNLIENGIPGSTVARSSDNGRSWKTVYDANNTLVNDRPFFLVESDDNVLLVYTAVPGGIQAVRSSDGGASFGLATTVTTPDLAGRLVQMGGPSVDAARRQLLIPYVVGSELTCTGGTSCLDRLGLARSSDHGATWSNESIAELPLGSGVNSIHSVTADGRGREYLTFSTGGSSPLGQHAWLMRNDGPGKPWSTPVRVDLPGSSSMMPWVVAEGDGHVSLAYYTTPHLAVEQAARPWHVEAAISTDGGRTLVRGPVSDVAYVGTEADHRATVWDLIAVVLDSRHRLNVAWTDARGKSGAAPTEIRYARQTAGPNL